MLKHAGGRSKDSGRHKAGVGQKSTLGSVKKNSSWVCSFNTTFMLSTPCLFVAGSVALSFLELKL